jgi:Tol biopolymer transport system component
MEEMMNNRVYPGLAYLFVARIMTACGLMGNRVTASSPEAVSTAVAFTPVGDGVTETPEPDVTTGLLPHSMYYQTTDSAGLLQIFRMEKDGTTIKQVTSESVNVGNYGVSPMDGSVAYVANNQLTLVNADGTGRRVLVDGGPAAESSLNNITNPVFSLDGQTLAYGYQGLNLYSLSNGVSERVLEDRIDDMGNGVLLPAELYRPEKYSPDGSKLLVTIGLWEGATAAVYDPATKALVRLQNNQGALVCCDKMQWSADGAKIYSANPSMGMYGAGLWAVDPVTGEVSTLLASGGDTADTMVINYANKPYLAPDDQLYYFFTTSNNPDVNIDRIPLQIVRSAPNGVTGRTVIREDTFEMMNEALWSPDASSVIVVFAPFQDVYQGGRAEIVYLDGMPNVVLASSAQQLKWGP